MRSIGNLDAKERELAFLIGAPLTIVPALCVLPLSVQGTWVEHPVEYPSKKEIVQTHFVKLAGTLDSTAFRAN